MKTFYYIFITAIAFLFLGRVCGVSMYENTDTHHKCIEKLTFIDTESIDDYNEKIVLGFSFLLNSYSETEPRYHNHKDEGMYYHFVHNEEYNFTGCILFEADSSPPRA